MIFGPKKTSRAAFEKEALEHLDALYGTALRMTARVEEAEDLVQDTCLRALRFYKKFQPGTNLKAWLFRMMVNLFINRYRRARRGREIHEGIERYDVMERMVPAEQLAKTGKPEEYFFEKLFSDDVVLAIDELPHDFKMVVLLADVNDFSYAQIAEILGIPVGTVMSRLHRGRKLLRAALYSFAVEEGYIKPVEKDEAVPTDLDSYRKKKNGQNS
ncbi:sigma-70 family RNA polymerase sigma factor [Myxococcota bacterium]